jgi:hypothetical protein
MIPMSAVAFDNSIYDQLMEGPEAMIELFHGYTYSAHPVGAAAVVACLAETKRLNTKTNAAARGTQLYHGVLKLQKKYDIIGDVRGGEGLMIGIEIVSDKTTKTPMDNDTMKRIHQISYEAGTMVRLGLNNILMSPPLVITEQEVNEVLAALDKGFSAA